MSVASSRNLVLGILLPLFLLAPSAAWLAQEAGEADEPSALAKAVAQLQEQALNGDGAYRFLEELTEKVGPRSAGSAGDKAAVAWARARLEALGFENVRTEPVTVPHWQRGTAFGEILDPFPRSVVLTALGGSVATPEGGLEAAVVRVASVQELKDLPAEAVAGKIVYFDGGRMPATRTGEGYGPAVLPRALGAYEAAPKGAAAVIIRSAGSSSHRFSHTGSMRPFEKGTQPIPAAALSNSDADQLSAQLDRGESVRFRLEINSRHLPDEPSANVIGEIVGREKPQEIVLLVAHLDSWDLGTGAIDDGAGCAIVTEAARLIAGLGERPRRTIRVVLTANEEFGLSGARAYAEAHAGTLDRHVAGLEADLGAGRVWAFASAVDEDRLGPVAQIAALLSPLDIPYAGNTARGGADLSPLRQHRVPVFDLRQDATLYFDYHHTADDTLDKVDPKELAHNVAAYATVAYAVAELEGDFGRGPVVEERRR
jgi:hypothetical protein